MMSELRNSELDSGKLPLKDWTLDAGIPRHYEPAELVRTHVHKSLDDYLGDDGAECARAMLDDMKQAHAS